MKILGDSNISEATITATNIGYSGATDKLKTFVLSNNMRTLANNTVIDLDFSGDVPDMDTVALCGTNLTPSAVVQLSYSDTDINSPDAIITLPLFSTFNQVFLLSASLNKRYWRLTISDSSLSEILIGYIYAGVALDIEYVEFGHSPELSMFSNPSVTATGQGYGSKFYNALPVEFTMLMKIDLLRSYMDILQEKQNIDPVLLIEYIESYDIELYRPKYGVLINDKTPYPLTRNNLTYAVSARLEERF